MIVTDDSKSVPLESCLLRTHYALSAGALFVAVYASHCYTYILSIYTYVIIFRKKEKEEEEEELGTERGGGGESKSEGKRENPLQSPRSKKSICQDVQLDL